MILPKQWKISKKSRMYGFMPTISVFKGTICFICESVNVDA